MTCLGIDLITWLPEKSLRSGRQEHLEALRNRYI